jgi:mannose-6-phosphate isomerase-like protein (cupin superfamily)
MSMATQQGIKYLPPESGETLWVMGDQVTFKTDGERDGLTLFVSTIAPGGGPPPHVHYLQEEVHYVLEGIFSFLNGSEWIEARAGSFIWIPREVRHTFRNIGSEPGRLFSTNTLPGAHERWFRHVGVPMPDRASFQPPQGAPDMADVLTSAARQDIHLEPPNHA